MDKPIIVDNKPVEITLNANETIYWCRCGKSKSQPFCDGSHEGTSFVPVAFTPEKTEAVFLCLCKHTKTPPFCDGTHAKFK